MKNNKGIGLVGVLIIIGVVVIAGGVVYYAGTKNNSPQPPLDNTGGDPAILQNQNDIANNNSIIKIKTYTNSSSGYQLDYPLDWYVKNTDIATSYDYNSFVLQNTEDAVLPGSDFSLKTSGSYISVSVKNNMNYSSYEEYIKNSGLPPKAMAERMANLEMVNIGGKTFQAFTGIKTPNSLGSTYDFFYNKRFYSINFTSGSTEQFNKDKKIFEDLIASFKFLNTEESSSEIFQNQPGAIKSITVNGDNKWILVVDLLSHNPNFRPGDTPFFINQNTKVRSLNVTSTTKAYNCETLYANENYENSKLQNISIYIKNIQNRIAQAKLDIKNRIGGPIEDITDWATAYFDINGTNVTAIYQQCLP